MTIRPDDWSFAPPGAQPGPGAERTADVAASEPPPGAPGPLLEPPTDPPVGPPPGSDGRRANRALVAGLAVLVAGTWVLAARDRQPRPGSGGALEDRMAAGAWALCKRVVTERLGAPPAVQFPWFDQRAIERASDSVRVVRASVAASGPAGSRARVAFTCRARWLGGDRWLDDGTVVRSP